MNLLLEAKGNAISKKFRNFFVILAVVLVVLSIPLFVLRGQQNNASKPAGGYNEADHTYYNYISASDLYGKYVYSSEQRQFFLLAGLGSLFAATLCLDMLSLTNKTRVKLFDDHMEGLGFSGVKVEKFYSAYENITRVGIDNSIDCAIPTFSVITPQGKFTFASKAAGKCLEIISAKAPAAVEKAN